VPAAFPDWHAKAPRHDFGSPYHRSNEIKLHHRWILSQTLNKTLVTPQNRSMVNVICLKWGTRYDAGYVNRLRRMVQRHLIQPHRFVCLTDDTIGA